MAATPSGVAVFLLREKPIENLTLYIFCRNFTKTNAYQPHL